MEMALHHHPSHGIEMMTVVPRVAGSEEVVLRLVVGLGGRGGGGGAGPSAGGWMDGSGPSAGGWLGGGGGGGGGAGPLVGITAPCSSAARRSDR